MNPLSLLKVPGAAMALLALLAGSAWGQTPQVLINADSMQVLEDERRIRFVGEVEVVYGDITMRSAEGDALYGERGPQDITRYTARGGRVQMTMPGQTVDGDVAIYDFGLGTLTFTGSVVTQSGSSRIESETMIVHIDEGRTEFGGRDEADAARQGIVFQMVPTGDPTAESQ